MSEKVCEREIQTKSAPPRATYSSRNLSAAELDEAKQFFLKEPDWEYYADKFRTEAEQIMLRPPSAVKGIFRSNGALVGVGVVEKSCFDYAYWSLTWIMVDSDHRREGFGRAVVDTLLAHAQTEQGKSQNPNCRVLISAVNDQHSFYSHGWGFKTIADGPLPGEQLMLVDVTGPGLPLREPPLVVKVGEPE